MEYFTSKLGGVLFLLLAAVAANAQTLSWEEQKAASLSTLNVIEGYQRSCSLSENGSFSEAAANRFLSLFADGATIEDPFNLEGKKRRGAKPVVRTVEEFVEKTTVNYPQGLPIDIYHVYSNYDSLEYGKSQVFISRKVNRQTSITDTVVLQLRYERDYSIAKIESITGSSSSDTDGDGVIDLVDACPNVASSNDSGCPKKIAPDSDLDGVPDHADDCPELAGSKRTAGCPDSDGDGLPDWEDSCPKQKGAEKNYGCPVERDIRLIPTFTLGSMLMAYGNADFREVKGISEYEASSEPPAFTEESSPLLFGVGVDGQYFFSEHLGVSAGLHFYRFSRELKLDGFKGYFPEIDTWERTYLRELEIEEIEESVVVNQLVIPVNLTYRLDLFNAGKLLIQAGPAFGVPLWVDAESNGNANYGAIYDREGESIDDIDINDPSLYILNESSIEGDDAFERRREEGYAIGMDVPLSPEAGSPSLFNVMGQLQVGLLYEINAKMDIYFAAHAFIGSLTIEGREDSYDFNLGMGKYESLATWAEQSSLRGVGIKVGASFGL